MNAEVSDVETRVDCGDGRARAGAYRRADAEVKLAELNAMKVSSTMSRTTREAAAADGAGSDPSASLIPYALFVDG